MTAARGGRGGNRVDTQLVRDPLQQFNVSFNHGARRLREPRLEAKNEKRVNDLLESTRGTERGLTRVGLFLFSRFVNCVW